jgi:pseudouridine-5'-phosphate glycosidase
VSVALRVRPEVAAALDEGRPVVALESTLIAHGLPHPDNLRVAREVEAIVADEGAVAATIGVVAGVVTVGLDDAALERIATRADVVKLGVRDVAVAVAQRRDGATTVASTARIAAHAGIRVFATGGLGGVHREARETWDESADLVALATTPVAVVCAGVKSILDVHATLERLESLGVCVVGIGARSFPGFYLTDSGHPLDWSVDDAEGIAAVMAARGDLGLDPGALVVANPLPLDQQLDPDLHQRVLDSGLARLRDASVIGKDVTPFLLSHFHDATSGASLRVNIEIIKHNARVAARIAAAWAARR